MIGNYPTVIRPFHALPIQQLYIFFLFQQGPKKIPLGVPARMHCIFEFVLVSKHSFCQSFLTGPNTFYSEGARPGDAVSTEISVCKSF